jgi:hypothetical protein
MKADRILTATMAEPIWPIARPVDVTDATQFPAIAEARWHYASLSAERRAELENDHV